MKLGKKYVLKNAGAVYYNGKYVECDVKVIEVLER